MDSNLDESERACLMSLDELKGPIYLDNSPLESRFTTRRTHSARKWNRWIKRASTGLSTITPCLLCCILFLQQLLPDTGQQTYSMLYGRASLDSPLLRTDIPVTEGVVPRRLHSHNDYEQSFPLYTALASGASSVEADVWLIDGEVRIGHHRRDATPSKTLKSLYIDPLVSMLEQANPYTTIPVSGIFSSAPQVSLQLLIDFKEGSTELFEAVMAELEPLRSKGWLTNFDGYEMTSSAVTVIGSGEARLDLITALSNRDLFYDGKLHLLGSTQSNLTANISPMASTSISTTGFHALFFWRSEPYHAMQQMVDLAHSRGISARFWGTPRSPNWLRWRIWRRLISLGVDWLNTDHLWEAASF